MLVLPSFVKSAIMLPVHVWDWSDSASATSYMRTHRGKSGLSYWGDNQLGIAAYSIANVGVSKFR